MAGIDRPNIVSFLLESAVRDARNAEYTGTPFTDTNGDGSYNSYLGCNRAGGSSPGIGINTGDRNPAVRNWDGPAGRTARLNQESAHIGSGDQGQIERSGPINPSPGPTYKSSGITTDPLRTARGVPPGGTEDFNDQFGFQQATAATADGAVIANGVVNRTGRTMQNGEWAWGTITQAGTTAFLASGEPDVPGVEVEQKTESEPGV